MLAGDFLYRKSQAFWDSTSRWIKKGEKDDFEPAARDFISALLTRILKISTIGIILGVLPLLTVLIQTYLIYNQNKIISQQNALSGFEQASRFREILENPLNKVEAEKSNASEKPKPNLSAIDQIVLLGEEQTDLVVQSLKPLLTDKNAVVSSGAFIALQRLLTHPRLNIREQAERALASGERWDRDSFNLAVNLNNIDLGNVHLDGAKLRKAQLQGADLRSTFLSNADLSEANLDSADLSQSDLIGVKLKRANLSCGSMENSDLTNADLESFNGSAVSSSDYSDDKIPGVNRAGGGAGLCHGVNLDRAKLTYANLENADLSYAYLRYVDLTGAKLRGTDLRGADLSDAFFRRRTNFTIESLKLYWKIQVTPISAEYLEERGALIDEQTKFDAIENP